MHRFFIPPKECHNNPLRLSPPEAKHARSVLRLREGDCAVVLNGAGKELLCQAEKVSSDSVSLNIVQENNIDPLPFEVTLYQAVAKGKAMDFIVQKAAELGVHRIVPVLSERSVRTGTSPRQQPRSINGEASASSPSNSAAPLGCPG